MIKLELPAKPDKLTTELQTKLTAEFKASGNTLSVWHIDWLKEAILNKSFGKCCYSEVKLTEECKYMEVEHFAPKSIYPDLVMEWSNLLPSNKKCNASKSDYDTIKCPILNPFNNNPKDFLYFKAHRYCAIAQNKIGRETIDLLGLNDRLVFANKRADVFNQITDTLKDLFDNIDVFASTPIKSRNHRNKLRNLMRQGGRTQEYAALVSTTILEDENFAQLKEYLKKYRLWDEEFNGLKTELEFCSLLKPLQQ